MGHVIPKLVARAGVLLCPEDEARIPVPINKEEAVEQLGEAITCLGAIVAI